MKTTEDIEELCKKLKPVIGDKADKLWYYYLSGDDKGRKDLALDIEIIAEKLLKKNALEKQKILLQPPSEKDSSGTFLVGDVIYNDKTLHPLYLRPEDFTKQVGIFAVTGEGKTNLAYLLALQLLKRKTPFLVIDWKRSWRNLLSIRDKFPELKDVQVFTVGRDLLPLLWNPFRGPPGSERELWISTIADALEKSHLSGPGVAYYINKIYPKLYKGFTGEFYPNFYDGLKEINNIKAYERELRWKQTALRIFSSFTLGSVSKVFNARSPLKLENLLNKPIILELDLEMPKPLRIFFTEMILRWIHLYRLSQGETENLKHVLFLEEAHNLFTNSGLYKDTNSLENVYREIRAFGQGIVSITQHPSLLPIYLLGNCHSQIYLGLQHADDIKTARKSLFLKYHEEAYPNMLNVGESIVKIKNRIDPCLVKIPLVPTRKGQITDRWLKVNTPGYFQGFHEASKPNHPRYLQRDIYREKGRGKTLSDNCLTSA
jgi:DNA helicase HerA-like ATPase